MHRRSFLARATAVGSLGVAGGCLEPPSQRVDPREHLECGDATPQHPPLAATHSSDPLEFEKRWQSDARDRIMAVTDEQVIGNHSRSLGGAYGVDLETGELLWTYGRTGGLSSYTEFVVDDAVYFGWYNDVAQGRVYAIELDGRERWTYEGGDDEMLGVYQPPIVVDDTVYVGSYGRVYAIDAASGTRRWVADPRRSDDDEFSFLSLLAVEDAVYVTDGELTALDRDDGSVLWRYGDPEDGFGAVTIADDIAYIATDDAVAAVSVYGEELWRTAVATDPTQIYGLEAGHLLVAADNTLRAFDVCDGTERWTRDEFGDEYTVATGDGIVYLGREQLTAVAAGDGTELWQLEIDAESEIESLAVVDASDLEAADEQRGHWVHACTEHRFVQVASHGEKMRTKSFETEIVSHRTDGSLFVGTREAVYRFDPDPDQDRSDTESMASTRARFA